MFLERQAEFTEKCICLLIGLSCRSESDLHSEDSGDLVDVDLREYDLLLDTESIVASSIELVRDTVEIPDTRKSHPLP